MEKEYKNKQTNKTHINWSGEAAVCEYVQYCGYSKK